MAGRLAAVGEGAYERGPRDTLEHPWPLRGSLPSIAGSDFGPAALGPRAARHECGESIVNQSMEAGSPLDDSDRAASAAEGACAGGVSGARNP